METPSEIHIILALWGDAYIYNFFHKNLLSRLSDNNLPSLNRVSKVRFKIYSDRVGIKKIKNQSTLNLIEKFFELELIEIPEDLDSLSVEGSGMYAPEIKNKSYQCMDKIHGQSILESYESNAALIFDSPDVIYGREFFQKLTELILDEKRLILIPGMRLDRDKVYSDEIFKEFFSDPKGIPRDKLLELGLKYLHPSLTESRFIYGGADRKSLDCYAHLYWKINPRNVFIHAYHCHPFYIWPLKKTAPLFQSIDRGEYIFQEVEKEEQIYVSSKDDGFLFFELTGVDPIAESYEQKTKSSPLSVSVWAHHHAHPKQRKYANVAKHFFLDKSDLPALVKLRQRYFFRAIQALERVPFTLRYYLLKLVGAGSYKSRPINYYEHVVLTQIEAGHMEAALELYSKYVNHMGTECTTKFSKKLSLSVCNKKSAVKLLDFLEKHEKRIDRFYFIYLKQLGNYYLGRAFDKSLIPNTSDRAIRKLYEIFCEAKDQGFLDQATSNILQALKSMKKLKGANHINSLILHKYIQIEDSQMVCALLSEKEFGASLSRRLILEIYFLCYKSSNSSFRQSMITFFLNWDQFSKKVPELDQAKILPVQKQFYDQLRPRVKGKAAKYILVKKYIQLADSQTVRALLSEKEFGASLSRRLILRTYSLCYKSSNSSFRQSMITFFLNWDQFSKKVPELDQAKILPVQKQFYDQLRPRVKSKAAKYILVKKYIQLADSQTVRALLSEKKFGASLSRRLILKIYSLCYKSSKSSFRQSMITFFLNWDQFSNKVPELDQAKILPVQKQFYDQLRPRVKGKAAKYILVKKYIQLQDLKALHALLYEGGLSKALSRRKRAKLLTLSEKSNDLKFKEEARSWFSKSEEKAKDKVLS